MMIETKKGAKIELIEKDGSVRATHNGKDMGVVVAVANIELGWHLRAGTVALTVADKFVDGAKSFIAQVAIDNYKPTATDTAIDKHYADLAKIENANYASY